ncbi:1,2-phenylacetyl-CoA epoxidase subunit PaaD [Nocardioides acrostichi]|uniref:1,2-phenylacetyl-CoA epoxidase subunit PaaD n=1 Tax=Nocardioides acrostichi TaxID=2784339 RepID=UPI002E2B8448|nr:1,2-phenylacetyl-CoA epoxidase subunit PaaD [Nocardioides acrostichi]
MTAQSAPSAPSAPTAPSAERTAWQVAAGVVDPELPMLTLRDLGVLREVQVSDDGAVVASITPTYSGCPAMATMRDDLVRTLRAAGFADVSVRVVLEPPWTTDQITAEGRAALADAGISAPGTAPRHEGPVALNLGPIRRAVRCPRCGSGDVRLVSEFGSTACKAQYSCRACWEPFDHVKEI